MSSYNPSMERKVYELALGHRSIFYASKYHETIWHGLSTDIRIRMANSLFYS